MHTAFGKHFARSGEIDPKYHRWLLEAFTARIAGDYGVDMVLEAGEVEETIRRAEAFLQTLAITYTVARQRGDPPPGGGVKSGGNTVDFPRLYALPEITAQDKNPATKPFPASSGISIFPKKGTARSTRAHPTRSYNHR